MVMLCGGGDILGAVSSRVLTCALLGDGDEFGWADLLVAGWGR